jgi:antitoxin HigA-1
MATETEEGFVPGNPHLGDFIRQDFMQPWGMSVMQLAEGLGISEKLVAQILEGKRPVTAELALRLSHFLGCSPKMWLGMQADHDLSEARRKLGPELDLIQKYHHEGPLLDEDGRPMEEPVEDKTATAAA